MRQEALKLFPDINLVIWAMFIFVVLFAAMVGVIMHKSNKNKYDYISQLPLKEETTHE